MATITDDGIGMYTETVEGHICSRNRANLPATWGGPSVANHLRDSLSAWLISGEGALSHNVSESS